MNKLIHADDIINYIKDGDTVMIGGFLGTGAPEKIIDKLVERGIGGITLICNDTAFPDKGSGKLIANKQVKKAIVSHIGTNPETAKQMREKEIQVELVPQGTLAERIRCGGTGLGGVLTPTGIGTEVAKGKRVIGVENKSYLLETPLHADVALIYASVSDEIGNLSYEGVTKNFNPLMAMAADRVIAEAKNIVPTGELSHNHIAVPHILVDYIVKGAQ